MSSSKLAPQGKRTATYARASTPSQKDSIKDQLVMLDEHIEKNGQVLVGHFHDVGTGKNVRNRKAFQELRKLIKARAIDVLLTTEVSRLGRSTRKLLDLYELCKQNKVVIWDMRLGSAITDLHIGALGMV